MLCYVLGSTVRFRSRYLYECVGSRASWDAPVLVNSEVVTELVYWKDNLVALNSSPLMDRKHSFDGMQAFCDASSSGFGGFVLNVDPSFVIGSWSVEESCLSSTWRELEAVHRFVRSSTAGLKGQRVVVNTDNKNVCSILSVGSSKPYLHRVALNIHDVCMNNDIELHSNWIPRSENKIADSLSRCSDSDDWSVLDEIFVSLDKKWGPHTCDRFASDYNTKCSTFNSRFWCPGTSAVDAMKQNWALHNNWLVPPPRLLLLVIAKIVRDQCTCTLLVPEWRSAPFWPMLFQRDGFKSDFITDYTRLPPGRLTKRGRGRNGIFDGRAVSFGFIAIRIEYRL